MAILVPESGETERADASVEKDTATGGEGRIREWKTDTLVEIE